jgi:hypothetical protein
MLQRIEQGQSHESVIRALSGPGEKTILTAQDMHRYENRMKMLLHQATLSMPHLEPLPLAAPGLYNQCRALVAKNAQLFGILDHSIKYCFLKKQNERETFMHLRDRLLLSKQINFKNATLLEPLYLDPNTLQLTLSRCKYICMQYIFAMKPSLEGRIKSPLAQEPLNTQGNGVENQTTKPTVPAADLIPTLFSKEDPTHFLEPNIPGMKLMKGVDGTSIAPQLGQKKYIAVPSPQIFLPSSNTFLKLPPMGRIEIKQRASA